MDREGRVYLGDQNAGRLLILDIGDAGFVERRGPMGTVGAAVQACEVDAVTGVANVSDVLPLP